MIIILTSWLEGKLGFHKSVVELANGLHRTGRDVSVIRINATDDGRERMIPKWPLDVDIEALPLQTMAAKGGALLHKNFHPALTFSQPAHLRVTANQLEALREINGALTPDDIVIFNHPMLASVFQQALQGDPRNPRTVLQVHEDYQWSKLPWQILTECRNVIDQVQTVSSGLRDQFVGMFSDDEVTFVPNFPGSILNVEQSKHHGVNLVLPASFDKRKNQEDAVRAVSLVRSRSVHLALWGGNQNAYGAKVRDLIKALDVSDRVSLPGYGNDTQVYSTADILIMTSQMEGLPYTLVEAAARGIPAVTYDFNYGPRDIIEDRESGFIVPVGDVQAFADRIDTLASDESLREQFGRRARDIFAEKFSDNAVAKQYDAFFGSRLGSKFSLGEYFRTDGREPIEPSAISHTGRRAGRLTEHRVVIRGDVELCDVRIDDGSSVRTPTVRRAKGTTRISFTSGADEVISYTNQPGGSDRHYLANVTCAGLLQVRPYLRRDAAAWVAASSDNDKIVAITGAGTVLWLSPAIILNTFFDVGKALAGAVSWKIRQLLGIHRIQPGANEVHSRYRFRSETFDPWGELQEAPSSLAADPSTNSNAPEVDRAKAKLPTSSPSRQPAAPSQVSTQEPAWRQTNVLNVTHVAATALLRWVRRFVELRSAITAFASGAKAALAQQMNHPTVMGHRELPRHPWYPVTAGIDNFGAGINDEGGVVVRNSGSFFKPTVTLTGEYDWLDLRSGPIKRRVESPVTYREFYERLCEAEAEHGLFEMEAHGAHLWELGRSALVTDLANALGFWSAITERGERPVDVYNGKKRLMEAPPGHRVLVGYSKRGQSDYRVAAFKNASTIELVFPSPEGYPEVTESNLKYPLREFTEWQSSRSRLLYKRRIPEIDSRPFEEVLRRAFGIGVDLSDHLRFRLLKFLDEREFFSRAFEKVRPTEVLMVSGHWWAGVSQAARDLGILSSDIQYANTGKYHSTYWFGARPHHGPERFYAWSDYWARRTNVYRESVVVPRMQPELTHAIEIAPTITPRWDIAVLGQPTVTRRLTALIRELVEENPRLRMVYAPHPYERRETVRRRFDVAGIPRTLDIAEAGTINATLESKICVGAYSTSMWEAASMGRPVYVLPVPGSEIADEDLRSGLFRPYAGPGSLYEFEVPESRQQIFTFRGNSAS